MGKFRNFIINEQLGLGDLGAKIQGFTGNHWLHNRINGAFLSSDMSGTEQPDTHASPGHPLHLPSTDLTIPMQERTGRITMLEKHKNPIRLRLSDGTEAFFTYDEYKRIQGTPQLGKTMTIIFQRHAVDASQNHSKIEKAIVRE